MKILYIIDCLSSGGKERRLIELMKALRSDKEIEFELAVMSHDVHFQEVFDLDIKIHYLIRSTKKDLSVIWKLYKLCKTLNPDLVHCWDSMTAVYSAIVCKILNIPFINGMVTNSPQNQTILNKVWLRARLTFPFSDYIIGNSNAGIAAYRAPRKKSFVIPNGFNFSRIEEITDKNTILNQIEVNSKFVVGMVASHTQFKDYKTYFEAAQIILNSRTDVTFLAIGRNTDSISASSLIEIDKQKYFRLLGNKSRIESFVNCMDICVLSTFTEGISNSILEYMAMGKPVIATSGGGTNEIIENNNTGLLVEVSNPYELAEKIQLLLNDANLRTKMGNAGKARIQKVFSIDAMLGSYIKVYKNAQVSKA